jgi:transposase
MAYDKKFRERAIEYKEAGHTFAELREAFKIAPETYYQWQKLRKETGTLEARKVKTRKPRKIEPERLREYIAKYPDAYLCEIASEFKCAPSAIPKALKRLNITRKKRLLSTKKRKKTIETNT